MEFEAITTEELTQRVATRLAIIWGTLDRLDRGREALEAAKLTGDAGRVARITTKLAEVEATIADYFELVRRSPRTSTPTTRGQESGQSYGSITGWEPEPDDPCPTCSGRGWHPPCRKPVALPMHGVREADEHNPEIRHGDDHPHASV